MDENNDMAQDLDTLKPFKDAILFLADKLEAQQQRIDNLEDLLCNQVIGGIKSLYDDSVRTSGIDSLKSKYGDKITPYEGVMPEFGIKDWSSELYDHLQGMAKDTPDWGDEHESGAIDSLIQNLQAKIDKISGATGAKPVSASVTLAKGEALPVDPEATAEGAPDAEPDNSAEIIDAVKKLRQGKNARDISR